VIRNSNLLVVLIVVGCGKGDDRSALPPATGAGSPPLPVLPTVAAAPAAPAAAITSDRKSTGTLLPHAQVAVVARASGVIVALGVDVGARVKQGDVVFRVDSRDAELHLAQARTQLAAAEQQLRATEVEHRRTQQLFDQHAASSQQWDQISAQLEAAKLGVAQARSGVAVASKAVSDATARAPIDGVVVTRAVALGDYVTAMPATQVVTLQDQATLDLEFRLPERALAHVRPGDPITVSLPALGVSRKAAIAIVAPSVDARTRTVGIKAVLDNRDGALRPGLMADIELGERSETTGGGDPDGSAGGAGGRAPRGKAEVRAAAAQPERKP
jgi:RND family efflux transporter MFP subunit